MQILVLYYSRGGNTRKLAEAVSQGVKSVDGVSCLLRSTDDVSKEDFIESNGIIAGSPVYFGVMAAELKKVIKSLRQLICTTLQPLQLLH